MYYSQETDFNLLLQLFEHLENKTVIDIGAEKGSMIQGFLARGCKSIFAFEPYPPHVEILRSKFKDVSGVHIHELAIGVRDETAILHIAHDKISGEGGEYYNSLIASADTPGIHWAGEIPVQVRSLATLVESGIIPSEIGILKIDTEGNDFAVLQGMGKLHSAVVMLEYWDKVIETTGSSPYNLEEVKFVMQPRGYSNFV